MPGESIRSGCRMRLALWREKFVAVLWRFLRGEAVAHDVFADDAREQKLEKIICAPSFGAAAAHLESAEGMATDDRAGAGAIDVNVAGFELGFGAFDIGRASREKSCGERVVGVVCDIDRVVE